MFVALCRMYLVSQNVDAEPRLDGRSLRRRLSCCWTRSIKRQKGAKLVPLTSPPQFPTAAYHLASSAPSVVSSAPTSAWCVARATAASSAVMCTTTLAVSSGLPNQLLFLYPTHFIRSSSSCLADSCMACLITLLRVLVVDTVLSFQDCAQRFWNRIRF